MIVKSDIGDLPPTLRSQFTNGVGRTHPLWRIASQGLAADDLDRRINFHACMPNTSTPERAFKLNLADSDPLASKIKELAGRHNLANSRVFEILVNLGWQTLESYANKIGYAASPSGHHTASQPPSVPVVQTAGPQPVVTTPAPLPSAQPQEKPQEPEFRDTPEFASIAQSMLSQFGIGIHATEQQ
ncbi:hypothetical protein RQP54_18560 [Curvibacter sp. APW13]|uniref:hypothetical protein n=1 Tax=Curvibacter sp. APW13 TaxID=3077236 RepID=UPI0028DDBFA4|nr:hypothetical protein [Curvibacter sp. APW13]MDT8992883.1 hypothetical protein [Curvibacter sp. APW13]